MIRTLITLFLLTLATTAQAADKLPKAPKSVTHFAYKGVSFQTPESAMMGKPIDRMGNMSLWKVGKGEVNFRDGFPNQFEIDIPATRHIRAADQLVDKMSRGFGKQPDKVGSNYYMWEWDGYHVSMFGVNGIALFVVKE